MNKTIVVAAVVVVALAGVAMYVGSQSDSAQATNPEIKLAGQGGKQMWMRDSAQYDLYRNHIMAHTCGAMAYYGGGDDTVHWCEGCGFGVPADLWQEKINSPVAWSFDSLYARMTTHVASPAN